MPRLANSGPAAPTVSVLQSKYISLYWTKTAETFYKEFRIQQYSNHAISFFITLYERIANISSA